MRYFSKVTRFILGRVIIRSGLFVLEVIAYRFVVLGFFICYLGRYVGFVVFSLGFV